jgi:hypothetical protein
MPSAGLINFLFSVLARRGCYLRGPPFHRRPHLFIRRGGLIRACVAQDPKAPLLVGHVDIAARIHINTRFGGAFRCRPGGSTWLPLGKHSPTIASRRRKGWSELPSSKNSDFFRPGAESLSEFDPEMQFQRVTHVRARERLPRCALLQGGVGSSAVNAGSAITVPIISGANAMRRAGYAHRFGGAAESASSVRGMPSPC